MKQFTLAFAGALLLAGCSHSTGGTAAAAPPPATLDPVGTYEYTTSVEGQTMIGTMTITGSPGAYSGTISSDMGTIPMRNISIEGMELSFLGDLPDVTVSFILLFDGDSFEGEWDAGGMMGLMSGTKR
jgi:hypothetical protein